MRTRQPLTPRALEFGYQRSISSARLYFAQLQASDVTWSTLAIPAVREHISPLPTRLCERSTSCASAPHRLSTQESTSTIARIIAATDRGCAASSACCVGGSGGIAGVRNRAALSANDLERKWRHASQSWVALATRPQICIHRAACLCFWRSVMSATKARLQDPDISLKQHI